MRKGYQKHLVKTETEHRAVLRFLSQNEQVVLPMVELIESGQMMVDEFITVLGRKAIELMLRFSAEGVAGEVHQGRRGGEIRRHGCQAGSVPLCDRKLRVQKPRLRTRAGREVEVPAYEAMRHSSSLAQHVCELAMCGVSTRNYEKVIPAMVATCGVSKSAVSREFVAASAQDFEALMRRPLGERRFLVLYIDGIRFAEHHVVAAIGVDDSGGKMALGVAEGATENAVVVKGLLEDLVARGLDATQPMLCVIDGSKALRSAIDSVLGPWHLVQRCRQHKIENVKGYLPKDLQAQVEAVMRAAYKLDAKEGLAKIRQQARWLEHEYPSAAASLLEGLEETFTINMLKLPPTLKRCLGTTNVIESKNSGVRRRTGRVTNWQDGAMVLRWAAAAITATEKNFRKIMGHKELWTLRAVLDERAQMRHQEVMAAA